jgi:hypothetical protein
MAGLESRPALTAAIGATEVAIGLWLARQQLQAE